MFYSFFQCILKYFHVIMCGCKNFPRDHVWKKHNKSVWFSVSFHIIPYNYWNEKKQQVWDYLDTFTKKNPQFILKSKIIYYCTVFQGVETGSEQRNKEHHQFMQCQAQVHTPCVWPKTEAWSYCIPGYFVSTKNCLKIFFLYRKYTSHVRVCMRLTERRGFHRLLNKEKIKTKLMRFWYSSKTKLLPILLAVTCCGTHCCVFPRLIRVALLLNVHIHLYTQSLYVICRNKTNQKD